MNISENRSNESFLMKLTHLYTINYLLLFLDVIKNIY